RGHFGDASGSFGDDDEIDDDQNQKHDRPDHVVATHHEMTEGLDHFSRVSFQQNQTRRGDIQSQSVQGHHQQDRRKHRELDRLPHINDDEKNQDRDPNADREQKIQTKLRDRQHQEQHDREQTGGQKVVAVADQVKKAAGA